MKKNLTRLLRIFPVLLLAASLAACVGRRDDETLTILGKKGDLEHNYLQRIIERYEEKTGNRVQIIAFENADFEKKAQERVASGDLPDLLLHFNDSNLVNLNLSENVYYLNDEAWVDELTDGARAYCLDADGNMLGLPFWENSISGCYYNKRILDELGLRPAVTQAEFDALCGALKMIGKTPMYWAGDGCYWMFQFGLDPIFADDPALLAKLNRNEITYADIPAVTDMLQWLSDAGKKGWFNTDYADAGWDDIAPAMENGDAASIFIWDTWFSTDFKEGGKYSAEDFALMPIFMGTAEEGTYEGGNMNMLMANRNSERLSLALDFLAFCADPENYNVAFDGVATTKSFRRQTTNVQAQMVTDAMPSVEANERVSTAWPKIIGYRQDDVGTAVLKLFSGEVDVAGCIALMDERRIAAARELGVEGF